MPTPTRMLSFCLLTALQLLPFACASRTAHRDSPSPSTPEPPALTDQVGPGSLEDLLTAQIAALERGADSTTPPATATTPPPRHSRAEAPRSPQPDLPVVVGTLPVDSLIVDLPWATLPTHTPEQTDALAAALESLAVALRENSEDPDPFPEVLVEHALAAILDKAASPDQPTLTLDEQRLLDEIVALLRSVTESRARDASRAADLLADAAVRLQADEPIRIHRLELCTRVLGFARYVTRDSDRFRAGSSHPVVVYVELDRFSMREAKHTDPGYLPGDVWAVELTQELSLSTSGVIQWREPEQRVVVTYRDRPRDFFLVQVVELPANLTIGAYDLKVTIRDAVSQATAEAVRTIHVVADASASP